MNVIVAVAVAHDSVPAVVENVAAEFDHEPVLRLPHLELAEVLVVRVQRIAGEGFGRRPALTCNFNRIRHVLPHFPAGHQQQTRQQGF